MEPLTLYVSMPVWWYRWDRPNRVFDRMNQSGRFLIDSPLLAQFTPHKAMWTSYMNLGQMPAKIACAGQRPFEQNDRVIFCLQLDSLVRGVLPRNLYDPF